MKTKIWKCVVCTAVSALMVSGESSYAMKQNTRQFSSAEQNMRFKPKNIFKRNYGFLEQIYGQDGMNVINEFNRSPKVEKKVVELFEATLNDEHL